MSLRNEVSVQELMKISDEVEALTKKRPELSTLLESVKLNLITMKVALSELEELREEHSRGNLTADTYLTRRKKLKLDYMLSKENISDKTLTRLLTQVKDTNEKSKLTKIKNKIVSNKDFINFLFQLISTLLSKT